MAEGNLSMRRYIDRHRRLFLPHFPTPLSILLLTVAKSFTCVRSQTGAIQIRVSDELTECVPSNITWTGGSPPYTLGISVGNFNHGPDQEYSNLSTTFFVWSTDVPAENFVQFAVGDGVAIAYSGDVDINAGLTQSCLPQPLDPSTSSSGGSNPTGTKTQGAPPSDSSMRLPSSTSVASTTVTVSVSVTGSAPGATTSSSMSSGSHSSLSPDVIGIIAAVAVVIAAAAIAFLYRHWARSNAASNSNASTPPPPPPPHPVPPSSPAVRATSIMSASPNYSPVMSPPEGALQFAPYGRGHSHSSLPAPHRPAWQSAASIHTTHAQTYVVGPGSPAPRVPGALPYEPPGLPGGWNGHVHEAYLGRQEGVVAAPVEQGRLLTNPNPSTGHIAGGTVTSDGGSIGGYALLQRP